MLLALCFYQDLFSSDHISDVGAETFSLCVCVCLGRIRGMGYQVSVYKFIIRPHHVLTTSMLPPCKVLITSITFLLSSYYTLATLPSFLYATTLKQTTPGACHTFRTSNLCIYYSDVVGITSSVARKLGLISLWKRMCVMEWLYACSQM